MGSQHHHHSHSVVVILVHISGRCACTRHQHSRYVNLLNSLNHLRKQRPLSSQLTEEETVAPGERMHPNQLFFPSNLPMVLLLLSLLVVLPYSSVVVNMGNLRLAFISLTSPIIRSSWFYIHNRFQMHAPFSMTTALTEILESCRTVFSVTFLPPFHSKCYQNI